MTMALKFMLKRLRDIPKFRVAVVRLEGPIMPMNGRTNIHVMEPLLETAFSIPRLKAVALRVNSPGGSPTQSSLIYQRIRKLSETKNIPVYVFVDDFSASCGYLVSLAGNEIYANEYSIVGGIGVTHASFGYQKLIEKVGIERRRFSVGADKNFMDPFLPLQENDVKKLHQVMGDMFENFTTLVSERRKHVQKFQTSLNKEEIFSGQVWIAKRALEMGLIDGIGELESVLRQKFGDVKFVKLSPFGLPFFFSRFTRFLIDEITSRFPPTSFH